MPKNTHKQAISTNSTDYSINSQSKYNHLSKMVQKPLLSLSEKQAHINPQNTGYTAPTNGDFCLYILTCILYHAITKSLLYKFCLGSTKYIFQLVGYWHRHAKHTNCWLVPATWSYYNSKITKYLYSPCYSPCAASLAGIPPGGLGLSGRIRLPLLNELKSQLLPKTAAWNEGTQASIVKFHDLCYTKCCVFL